MITDYSLDHLIEFHTVQLLHYISYSGNFKNKIRIKNFHENHIKEEEKAFFIESILS